ncbi:MAG: exodeoxyribonuclease V subunit alpha [Gammaproteobacteria bacterium]
MRALESLYRSERITDIDFHFARLIARLDGRERPEVAYAAMLASTLTAQGHACVRLEAHAGRPLLDAPEAPMVPVLEAWLDALRSSPTVGSPGDYRPLILEAGTRLYLYRYWRYQQTIADALSERAKDEMAGVNLATLRQGIDRLFPRESALGTSGQRVAAAVAVLRRLCVVSGPPGSGKTSAVLGLLCLVLDQTSAGLPLRIGLAAPTGKAAARLQEAMRAAKERLPITPEISRRLPEEVATLHRLLGARMDSERFRYHRAHPLPLDVVVVDEASMIDLALMAKLLEALPPPARLILLGDEEQLMSVGPGAVFGDICSGPKGYSQDFAERISAMTAVAVPRAPTGPPLRDSLVRLEHSVRFHTDSGIGRLARTVAAGRAEEALSILRAGAAGIEWREARDARAMIRQQAQAIVDGYGEYLRLVREGAEPERIHSAFNEFRILCPQRAGPAGVEAVQTVIVEVLGTARLIDARSTWYLGRPVMVIRNHYGLKLFNGDIGILQRDPRGGRELKVCFINEQGSSRAFSPESLPGHETVFAMTVHKSQGSEFGRVVLILPELDSPLLTRELIYTAITRARKGLAIWSTERAFMRAIERTRQRSSGLRELLWGDALP